MGRIITSVKIENAVDPAKSIQSDASIDTGASYLTLPSAWKNRLGSLEFLEKIELETATQEPVWGEIYGPVKMQIPGFRPIFTEVLFLDTKPDDGVYEPLIGYIALEQSQAAVDMLGHRLLHIKRMDLKFSENIQ